MRVDLNLESKEPVVVSRQDYEVDRQRGYCVLEYAPAGEMVLKNPRDPRHEIRRPVPAVYMFRCMQCRFDAIDEGHAQDPKTGTVRTGLDLIKLHIFQREHPWPYNLFENPYGNVQDVIIEGVTDYTKEIETNG